MALVQPDIRPHGWRRYRLAQDWRVEWRGDAFSIPAGFEHDGASIPRWAWTASGLRPDGLLRAAALLHDAFYRHRGQLPEGWGPQRAFTRKEADVAFYDLMVEAGVPKWRAWVAYRAVRVGGWVAWRKHASP